MNIKAGEEREALVKIRVNQGEFRKGLLRRKSCCCLCGIENEELLIASHIKPWSKSTAEEKTDIYNGLLLCPNHDKLFDGGWITFDKDGKIIISKEISNYRYDKILLNIDENKKIDVYDENRNYIKYHRENIFRDNKKEQIMIKSKRKISRCTSFAWNNKFNMQLSEIFLQDKHSN